LFPHLSVGGNLLFGLTPSIARRDQRRRMVEQALIDVELEGFFDRDPATLSGGQKARVALQRVMLSAPRLLLLDEPFSKLDSDLRQQTRGLIFTRAKSAGLPVVLVTHDQADADAAGGPVIVIGEDIGR
jgi:putative thiamine transport system ATP-binding protein